MFGRKQNEIDGLTSEVAAQRRHVKYLEDQVGVADLQRVAAERQMEMWREAAMAAVVKQPEYIAELEDQVDDLGAALERSEARNEQWVGDYVAKCDELHEVRAAAHERIEDEKALTMGLCRLVGRWRERGDEAAAARDRWYARAMAAEDTIERMQATEGPIFLGPIFVGDAESVEDAEEIASVWEDPWDTAGANTCTGGELFDDLMESFGGSS